MIRASALLLAAVALISCTPRRRAEPAAAPAATSTGGSLVIVSGGASYTDPGPASSGTCGVTLAVYDVNVRAGCVIDAQVTAAPATLSFPCGGGPAAISFGRSAFTGTVDGAGNVDLSLRTGFDFTDGCHWETKQFIRGNLGSGALSYEYREEPDAGQAGCAAACLGTAAVRVSR